MDNLQVKGTPPISKQAAYSKAASHFIEALDIAVAIMRKSDNDSNRIAAARMIINKVLPDLKSTDFSDGDGRSLIEKIIIVKAGDEDKAVQVAG